MLHLGSGKRALSQSKQYKGIKDRGGLITEDTHRRTQDVKRSARAFQDTREREHSKRLCKQQWSVE